MTLFPDVLGDNNILLAGAGEVMVEQTIGFVAGIPLCLSAVIDQHNIMIHVADAGIMKVLATFMFSIGAGVT